MWHNRYADGHTITIHQSFYHDCTYTANCLIDSQSPTHRRQPVADQSQPISNQLAINRPPVADQSSTGRRLLGIVVADQSPIDLQPKNCSFDCTVVALVAAVFSRKAVADRLQNMCDRGLNRSQKSSATATFTHHACNTTAMRKNPVQKGSLPLLTK